MNRFSDIHCHPTLRPFAIYTVNKNNPETSVWFNDKPRKHQRKGHFFPEYTQSDFFTLNTSGTKLIFLTLYPFEQGWFKAKDPLNEGIVTDLFVKLLTHLPVDFINKVQSDAYNYFRELNDEYDFISNKNKKQFGEYSFEIIKNGNHLKTCKNPLKIIITIEGAHSFISGNSREISNGIDIDIVLENIDKVKSWTYRPFFITFCHHFYNGFAGHARSIYSNNKISRKLINFLSQEENMNTGINSNGWKIIKRLLSLDEKSFNKPRILIDTKHMSINARMEFLEFIADYNKHRPESKKIPVIASHMGYSGWASLNDALIETDNDDKYDNSLSEFNICSLNLTDDEIRAINQSGGIIGLNLDQRILSGKKIIDNKPNLHNLEKVRKYWGRQLFKNIKSIAKAVIDSEVSTTKDKKAIWNQIALGTDFDGMINPVDAFITAADFSELKKQLIDEFINWPEFYHYNMGFSPKMLTDNILYKNAYLFAVRHYK
jgi:hypothetical protein